MTPAQRERSVTIAKAMMVDVPSAQEVAVLVASVIKTVKDAQVQMKASMNASVKECMAACEACSSQMGDCVAQIESGDRQVADKAYKDLNSAIYNLEQQIKAIEPYDEASLEAKWTLVVHEINAKLDAIKPFILQAVEVRDSLESLQGEDRLDASAIKNLDRAVSTSVDKRTGPIGGMNTIQLSVNGVLKGTSRYLNLVAGSGVTLTPSNVGESTYVVISAGGGSLSEVTVSGTIDDSNVTFTSVSQPSYLIINGAWYKPAGGSITWSYVTGTITLSQAIGTGGNIYGLS